MDEIAPKPMISLWHKTRSRIAHATWHELQIRATQGVTKRLDLLKFRAGFRTDANGWSKRSALPAKFFFETDDLPRICASLRGHLSHQVEDIVARADELLRHRFRLLGYQDLEYGSEIDWHLDAVNGCRAPLKPWFQVPFLNFAVVGDHKVTWELNRHQHLVTLAKAWALTHQERYATEILQQWSAWQLANPFPLGINWSSSLEVAFRSLSWLWVRALLAACPAIAGTFEAELLHALALHGRYIERYLSTYFSPNTHLIGEGVALFFIGTLCPQIPASQRWRERGWRIILQEAERQIGSDGVYYEQSLYYHVYALDFFLHARLLAARNEIDVPKSFDLTLNKMLNVLQAVSQSGPPEGFGDDDGGRVFDSLRNRVEHLTDPLAIGALILEREDLARSASLTEEVLWLAGPRAASRFVEKPVLPAKSNSFEAGGIYVMASSGHCTQRLVIDAGPMGAGHGGHAHADALSITLSVDGRSWLIDPGTFCYVAAHNKRDRFRGTGAHNTLRVDGMDQAVPEGPFAWRSIPKVDGERWLVGSTFSLFKGSHSGYLRLPDPVLHRRFVFHLHNRFWLVRDRAYGLRPHLLETSWHFAPDLTVQAVSTSFLASPAKQDATKGTCLALVPLQDPAWASALLWDEVSAAYGIKQAARTLRMSSHISLPAEYATAIVPLLHGSEVCGKLLELSCEGNQDYLDVAGYQFDHAGCVHYMMFSTGGRTWSLGPWTSDAEFIYCGVRHGRMEHVVFCYASFAKIRDQSVFNHDHTTARLEWLNEAGVTHVHASDDTVLGAFSQGVMQSCELIF